MTSVPSHLSSLTGGVVAVVALVIALLSLVLLEPIILIVANRSEPDERGMRPQSVYLFGMSFVTLQLTFAGSVLIVTSLISLIAPHVSPLTNSVARAVVIGGLIVVLAGLTLVLHLGRASRQRAVMPGRPVPTFASCGPTPPSSASSTSCR
jgi:hypothetical protein